MRDDELGSERGGSAGDDPHPDEGTIHAWLDNALPVYDAAVLDRHVANCPACALMVAEARALTAAASRVVRALDGDEQLPTTALGNDAGSPGSRGAASSAPRGPVLVRDAAPSQPTMPRATGAAPARRPLSRWRVTPGRAAAATLLLVAGGSVAVLNDRGRGADASAATDALVMDLATDTTSFAAAAPSATVPRGVEGNARARTSTAEAEQAFAPELAARRRLEAPVAAVGAPPADAVLGEGQGGVGPTASTSTDRIAAARKAAPSQVGDPSMQQRAATAPPSAPTAALIVTRPTVVAFLVVPPGSVEARPDMAVTADDWNVAMATLGDSLRAQGIELALVTAARLRLGSGGTTVMLELGVRDSAGYIYVRPGASPCLEHGARNIDDVLARARARLGPAGAPGTGSRDGCAR